MQEQRTPNVFSPAPVSLRFAARRGTLRGMSFTAVVENGVIKLPAGVSLPDGTRVEIATAEQSSERTDANDSLDRLAELAEPMGRLSNNEIDAAIYGR